MSGTSRRGLTWSDGRETMGTMPRVAPAKTLADQVSEIEKLIFDAQQTLSQASYALETLQDRIARAAEALPEDTPPTK